MRPQVSVGRRRTPSQTGWRPSRERSGRAVWPLARYATDRGLSKGKAQIVCFFFQAEDGIRDLTVTGVQTCALPIGATAKEIVFTSGATESNNLAIKGVAEMYAEKGNHIITAATEHKAVLDTCKRLEKHGIRVTYLPVQTNGLVDLEMFKDAITDKTILVSIMYANNEIGVIQNMVEIGKIAKAKGVLVHSDGTQAAGKIPVNVIRDNIDLMSLSGHKLYGPKGVGALYVRRKSPRVQITAQMDGGGHERGMRSGTLNVPGIVGLGEACALCNAEMAEESKRLSYLRDKLKNKLMNELDEVYVNGTQEHRLPNN